MAQGDIGAVLDTLEFDDDVGQNANIIHISGDVYAVAYSGPGTDGWLCTFTIDSAGAIGAAVIDTLEFDTTSCTDPKMIHVSGDIYAIVYEAETNIEIVTVDIDTAGVIENAVVDTFQSTDSGSNIAMGDIIHVSGDYFAVAYMDTDFDGKVITIDIDSAGTIGSAETDTLEFDTSLGGNPSIVNVSGTMYAIAYTGPDNDGWVCTFNISTAGAIDAAVTATLEFETDYAASTEMVHVSGDYYAIAYKGPNTDGFVKTLPIYSVGTIGAVVSTLEFDTGDAAWPSIIKVGGTVFAIAYEGVDSDGFIKTFTISSAGVISAVIGTLEFDTSAATDPTLLLAFGATGLVIVAYEGADNDGFAKTALIEVAASGERAGVIAIVEQRIHYVDAYGTERHIQGTAV